VHEMGQARHKALPGFVAVAAAVALGTAMGSSRAASASPPPPELMARLAEYAARLDSMRTHASYHVEGELSTLDRSGKPDSRKAMDARVDTDGKTPRLVVLHYTEDGEDKTADARQKALEREEKRRKEKKDKTRLRIPILATEQPRYVFDQVEVDPAEPFRVKLSFVPRVQGDDTIEGSAWVDTRSGSLLSAGFKMSKTSMFVDYVHFTVEFGESTPLGTAPSTVHVEGQGGILFFRKRFQGTARVHDYTIVP
jgi:hypothetical protein